MMSNILQSSNYTFIRIPKEFEGLSINQLNTQEIIINWLEDERSKGHELVSAFETSSHWLFDVTPKSVRFIKDEI